MNREFQRYGVRQNNSSGTPFLFIFLKTVYRAIHRQASRSVQRLFKSAKTQGIVFGCPKVVNVYDYRDRFKGSISPVNATIQRTSSWGVRDLGKFSLQFKVNDAVSQAGFKIMFYDSQGFELDDETILVYPRHVGTIQTEWDFVPLGTTRISLIPWD